MIHQATVRHLSDGWLRWQPVCTCGWKGRPSGREQADRVAAWHARSAQ